MLPILLSFASNIVFNPACSSSVCLIFSPMFFTSATNSGQSSFAFFFAATCFWVAFFSFLRLSMSPSEKNYIHLSHNQDKEYMECCAVIYLSNGAIFRQLRSLHQPTPRRQIFFADSPELSQDHLLFRHATYWCRSASSNLSLLPVYALFLNLKGLVYTCLSNVRECSSLVSLWLRLPGPGTGHVAQLTSTHTAAGHSIAQQSRALLLLAAGDPSQQKGAKGDRKLLHSRLVSQDYLFLSYFRLLLSAAAVLYLSMLVPSSSLHTLICNTSPASLWPIYLPRCTHVLSTAVWTYVSALSISSSSSSIYYLSIQVHSAADENSTQQQQQQSEHLYSM